jgi:Ca2+-binding EF-hand superfamily protein
VRLNGTYDIAYDDGESEMGVAADMIRSLHNRFADDDRLDRRDRDRFSDIDRDRDGRRVRDDDLDLRVGDPVEADYRSKGRYLPGRVSRIRLNGDFDIDFDDGSSELSVPPNRIRAAIHPSRSPSRDDRRGEDRYRDDRDDRVDRDRRYGHDRGNSRDRDRSPLRGERSRAEAFRVGDEVELDEGRGRRAPAVVVKARPDDTYDVELDNGDIVRRVDADTLSRAGRRRDRRDDMDTGRGGSRRREEGRKRAADEDDDDNDDGKDGDERDRDVKPNPSPVFRSGDRVACYWYRSSALGTAKFQPRPKAAIVMFFNADGSYTVELELGGTVIEDVAPQYIKTWAEGTADLRVGGRSQSPTKRGGDKWASVFEMAREMVKQGGIRHAVPTPTTFDDRGSDPDDKIRRIVGNELYRDFVDTFERQDRHRDGEIDLAGMLAGFAKLGGKATEEEVRRWAQTADKDGKVPKAFRFVDFVLAYANVFFPSPRARGGGGDVAPARSRDGDAALGKSLRLSGEYRALGGFARAFGQRQLRAIERAFDARAQRDVHGTTYLAACDVLEVFHALGRAITVTRLQEWMAEADVKPQDRLTLADFTSVFAFFFGPGARGTEGEGLDLEEDENGPPAKPALAGKMTLSEVAVQVLQEERWRGTPDQTNAFVRRLVAGRPEAVADCVGRVRDAFDALDADERGEVSASDVAALVKKAQLGSTTVDLKVKTFLVQLGKQGRSVFSLPELVVHFGPEMQELADASVSVAEAFAMLRMHLPAADVRLSADLALKVRPLSIALANPYLAPYLAPI